MKKSIVAFLLGGILFNALTVQSQADEFGAWLSKTEDSPIKVDSLNEMAWILRWKEPVKATEYAWIANALAQNLKYQKGEADSHARLGVIAKTGREFETAKAHYDSALTLRKEIGYVPDIARMYNNLGALYEQDGDIRGAIEYYKQGLGILEASDDGKDETFKEVRARFHNNIGDSYQKIGEYDKAWEHLAESIKIREGLNDGNSLASSYLNAGVFYLQEELMQPDSCGKYLRRGLELFEKHNDAVGQAKCLLNLGNLYFHLKKNDDAESFYDKALATGGAEGLDSLRIFRNKGSLHFQRGNYELALETYLENLEELKRINAGEDVAMLYSDIGNVYFEMENNPKAIEYLKKSRKLADSLDLFGVKLLSTTSLANGYEWELKEKEQRTQNLIIISLISLLAVASIAILLVRYNRKKRQVAEQNEEIVMREIDELLLSQGLEATLARAEGQDQERDRIAADLHDRIGMMLSTILLYFDDPAESGTDDIPEERLSRYHTAQKLLNEACQEVRRISHDMASPILTNQGLEAQLQVLGDRIQEARDTRVKIHTFGMRQRLAGLLELKVYPIITGILSNVLKHAKATEIDIELNRFDDYLNIMIKDNGRGFEPDKVMVTSRGMGFPNIVNRVGELHGEFEVHSGSGQGTVFTLDIPLEA